MLDLINLFLRILRQKIKKQFKSFYRLFLSQKIHKMEIRLTLLLIFKNVNSYDYKLITIIIGNKGTHYEFCIR